MEVRFNDQEKVVVKKSKISQTSPLYFKIMDEVEGDIELSMILKRDTIKTSSFTRYLVKDAHHAEIQICNALDEKNVQTKEKIKIGTYANEYKLFLQFRLEPLENKQRNIEVIFIISKD